MRRTTSKNPNIKHASGVTVFALSALCGCTTYLELVPTGTPSASLELRNANDSTTSITPYKEAGCHAGRYVFIREMMSVPPGTTVERRIAARQHFTFTAELKRGGKYCSSDPVTFVPSANAKYVIAVESREEYCRVSLLRSDMSSGTEKLVAEPSLVRKKMFAPLIGPMYCE
jgi:hypothetical protein